ncbi:MAG: hypothetical protein AABY32_02320 [Nanoarchaeota archaeon]
MKHFCTVSDVGYSIKGLVMYKSLLDKVKEDFLLEYLCLDDPTYNRVKKLNYSNLVPIHINELCNTNQRLYHLRHNGDRLGYYYMLASYITNYLMENRNYDDIFYIDSDIFFYQDIKLFADEIKDKDICITRHLHVVPGSGAKEGEYNVGVVYFRNTDIGRKVLYWWRDCVLNCKDLQYNTCYDQGYLNGFIPMAGDRVHVMENLVYGAPWHWRLFGYDNYTKKDTLTHEGKEKILLYNHFSRMQVNFGNNSFDFDGNQFCHFTNGQEIYKIPIVRHFYDDYFHQLKWVNQNWG